jgi:predicted porin
MNNKIKLIAAAVAGTFGLPLAAQAQEPSVQVYGRLYPQINNVRVGSGSPTGTPVSTLSAPASGAPSRRVLEEQSPNSRLGFRGREDLGRGMRAFFQLEMAIGLDTGAAGSGTSLFSRNTFVGMGGGFGSVKLGLMDTVYKELGDTLPFLGVSSGNFVSNSNTLSRPGFGTSGSASFHLRRANSIYYESPQFGGLQALLQYSPDEAKTATRNANLVSAGIKYESGPIYLALAHEIHNDTFGGSNSSPAALSNVANQAATSKDTGTRATVQYKFTPDTRAEINVAQLRYKETGGLAGRFESYKHNAYHIGVEHRIGAVMLAAAYSVANAGTCTLIGGLPCTTTGLDGKMLNLGAGYYFSKRTSLFALFSKLINGNGARYNSLVSGNPDTGADITQLAVGIQHNF